MTRLIIVTVVLDEEESTYAHDLKLRLERMLEEDEIEAAVRISRMKVPG